MSSQLFPPCTRIFQQNVVTRLWKIEICCPLLKLNFCSKMAETIEIKETRADPGTKFIKFMIPYDLSFQYPICSRYLLNCPVQNDE